MPTLLTPVNDQQLNGNLARVASTVTGGVAQLREQAAYGAPYAPTIVRDQIGVVRFGGLVNKPSTAVASEAFFTTVAGFRPATEMIFPLVSQTGIIECRMSTSGVVYAVPALAANTWVALDGIPSYYAAN